MSQPSDLDLPTRYIKYLRDVSRKLVMRGGFDQVLKGTTQNPDCVSLLVETRTAGWMVKASQEAAKSDRQLFLGIGIVVGSLRAHGRKKKIGAPIFFAQADVDDETQQVNVIGSTLTVNFDLVQHLLRSEVIPDEESQRTSQDKDIQDLNLLLDNTDEIIKKATYPTTIFKEPDPSYASSFEDQIHGFLTTLRPLIGNLVLERAMNCTNARQLREKIDSPKLQYTTNAFLFTAKFPDQLSTYTSLQALVDQIESGTTQSALVQDMVKNALALQSDDVFQAAVSMQEIRHAIKYLPLTLSERQKNAIKNAWLSRVSYVEGPPGTGKSHTIAAIMLTALFMGKKVLLVSQKKAAVKVVREKLKALAGGTDVLTFISKDPEVKDGLRRDNQSKMAAVGGYATAGELQMLQKEFDRLAKLVDDARSGLADLRSKIKGMLKEQRDYYVANSEYISVRDQFLKAYELVEAEFIGASESDLQKWKRRVRRVGDSPIPSQMKPIDVLYLRATRELAIKHLKADVKFLEIQHPRHLGLYVDSLADCNYAYAKAEAIQMQAEGARDINVFRISYDQKLASLLVLQRHLVSKKRELVWRRNLVSSQEKANLSHFDSMLRNVNPNLIEKKMGWINYDHLTAAFPLWAGLIRDLGIYLPFEAGLFDLVVVDESSQVNIAEALPAFYRGKQVCVVGDRKQLGLNAAGLFTINRSYEQMAWNQHFSSNHPFAQAEDQSVIVSKHSILDFITNPNSKQPAFAALDEHFRSAPKLAEFTSRQFYNNDLRIMTMVAEKVSNPCFEAIQVGGQRVEGERYIQEEVDKVMYILTELIIHDSWRSDPSLSGLFKDGKTPSIGVLCFTTDQTAELRERIEALPITKRESCDLFCGTTEEFQGNERNIMLIAPGVDEYLTSAGFYNDMRRLNVATSRAINFTYFIYGGLPPNFQGLHKYLSHFDALTGPAVGRAQLLEKYYNWRYKEGSFDEFACDSQFELRVAGLVKKLLRTKYGKHDLKLFNQVPACGKFLDFVVYNPSTSKAFAIEVDGPSHFGESGSNYTDQHLEREEILKRAGWNILHIPYYQWYYKGWLADRNPQVFSRYEQRLMGELSSNIDKLF